MIVSDKSRIARPLAFGIAALLVAIVMPLSQSFAQQALRLRGTVTQVDGDKIAVRGSDGSSKIVTLSPDATVASVVPAKLSDIKTGRFVGTAARPEANGHSQAIEIHIFPVGSRLGEGHRPWDPEPGATMTNADVTATVAHSRNGTLTLTTGGQSYDIDVPRGTPIVAMNPGTPSQVKRGVHVVINQAVPQSDGSYTAKSVTVTTAKNWPPK